MLQTPLILLLPSNVVFSVNETIRKITFPLELLSNISNHRAVGNKFKKTIKTNGKETCNEPVTNVLYHSTCKHYYFTFYLSLNNYLIKQNHNNPFMALGQPVHLTLCLVHNVNLDQNYFG